MWQSKRKERKYIKIGRQEVKLSLSKLYAPVFRNLRFKIRILLELMSKYWIVQFKNHSTNSLALLHY